MKKSFFLVMMLPAFLAPAQSDDAMRIDLMVIRYADSEYETLRRQAGGQRDEEHEALEEAALDLSSADSAEIFPVAAGSLLKDAADKVEGSDMFETLYHVAWRQPLMPLGQAQLIRFLGAPQNGLLAGNARISFENNFLLQLSLLYDLNYHLNFREQNVPKTETMLIELEEVVEHGKIYYFDYPALGILLTARKTEN